MWTLMGYVVLYLRANITLMLTTKNHCGMPIPFPSCGLLNPFLMTNSTFILLCQLSWAAVSASYVSLRPGSWLGSSDEYSYQLHRMDPLASERIRANTSGYVKSTQKFGNRRNLGGVFSVR
jgi:hypothetical protein